MSRISHTQATRWRSVARTLAGGRPPMTVLRWLLISGSLTRTLRRHLGDSLTLQVASQAWTRPDWSEARLMGIGSRQRCLERRVSLLDGRQPVVLARSLIPESSLSGANRRLAQLGDRPLGQTLFAHPDARREALQLARLAACQGLFSIDQPVWARRSVLRARGCPLLVCEAFLPALYEPTQSRQRSAA